VNLPFGARGRGLSQTADNARYVKLRMKRLDDPQDDAFRLPG